MRIPTSPQLLAAGLLLTAAPALSWWAVGSPIRQVAAAMAEAPQLLAQVETASPRLTAEPSRNISTQPKRVAGSQTTSPDKTRHAAAPPVSAPNHDDPAVVPLQRWELDANAPRCEGVYVYIVSDWVNGGALATMALGKNSRGYPKRVGAHLGDYQVISIGPSGLGMGPAVWLVKDNEVCQALLRDDNPARKKVQRRKVRVPKQKKRKRKKPRRRKH